MELSLAAALFAGFVSFISPCCLPVVPAYLGQLGVVASRTGALVALPTTGALEAASGIRSQQLDRVAAAVVPSASATVAAPRASWGSFRGWRTLPNALAFVLGFGAVFTLFGTSVYVAAGPLRDNVPLFRQVGGVLLIVLGLNLMGVLRLSRLARSWRPLDRFVTSRPGAGSKGFVGGLSLGAIFAVGWTPCIGPTLGAILGLAAVGTSPQVVALLVAYSVGLGIPFLLLAVAVDRAPGVTGGLLRHGRTIELLGGGLVVVIGAAISFDWLTFFARYFSFLWPQV